MVGVRHSARHTLDEHRRAQSAVIIEWITYCAGTRPGDGAFDYAPWQSLFLPRVRDGHCGRAYLSLFYPARDAPYGKAGSAIYHDRPRRRSRWLTVFSLVDWRSPPLAYGLILTFVNALSNCC